MRGERVGRAMPRGRRIAIGTVCIAALLAAGLALRDRPTTAGELDAPWWSGFVDAVSAPAAPMTAVGDAVPAAADHHGPEERQVCGGAWVKVDADGQVEGETLENGVDAAALFERTIARLRSDSDEYARAVGVWMQGDEAALVGAATATTNPKVYALAFRACRRSTPATGPCRLLGAAQWARLDAGNAAPWLFLLEDASARGDAAGVDEALFQIGSADRNVLGAFEPLGPIVDAMPTGESALRAASSIATQAAVASLASAAPSYPPLMAACNAAGLGDANRRQVCTRVADLLSERSDELLTRAVGSRLWQRATGSADRLELHRAQLLAWAAADNDATDAMASLGCPALRRTIGRLGQEARQGEVGMVRAWVAQSGLSEKTLLARSRAHDAGIAAASASAASVPTASADR